MRGISRRSETFATTTQATASTSAGGRRLHVMNYSSLLIYPDDPDFANYTDLMGLLSSNAPTRELT